MRTVTAFKWVPPFAQGMVRDHRVRWVLEEVGWPYAIKLIDGATEIGPDARQQPFGQVPALIEDGRPTLFESGAIVLDVAMRTGKLLPADAGERALALSWLIAALNSVEPTLSRVAEMDFFEQDEEIKARRRPVVAAAAHKRLAELESALGDREWLVGDAFTVADLMMGSVLKLADATRLLAAHAKLAAYHGRCLDRPGYRKAIADQCATFKEHPLSAEVG